MCVCVLSTFSNIFSSETTGPIEAKFHIEPPWEGGMKFCSNRLGYMTKMATMPIMVKTLKNLLLRNRKADDLETWNAASGAVYYQVCSNDDPGLTSTYFMARLNLLPYASVWEKGKTMDFSETIVVYDLKLARDDLSNMNFLLKLKILSPGGCMPPAPGYIHVLNHEKNYIKLDFKDISLKVPTNG